MAETTKKATTSPKETEEVKMNPWDEKVAIRIPKATNGEPNSLFVAVNGRPFKVMRGTIVTVPKPVAIVLENSYEAEEQADAYVERITNK